MRVGMLCWEKGDVFGEVTTVDQHIIVIDSITIGLVDRGNLPKDIPLLPASGIWVM